jgi:DNA-binding winged helix-turn-helix (wHTH) protein
MSAQPDILIFPVEWKLSRSQRIILATLVYSPLEITTSDAIFDALYADRAIDDQPMIETIRPLMWRLRKRVPDWVKIVAVVGVGFTINRDIRKRLLGECNRAVEELQTILDTMPLAKLQKIRNV